VRSPTDTSCTGCPTPPRTSRCAGYDAGCAAEILPAAVQADAGFDLDVFIDMLRSHRRLRNEDFPDADVNISELRAYFDAWADQLKQ
jgi:hypothetical protein